MSHYGGCHVERGGKAHLGNAITNTTNNFYGATQSSLPYASGASFNASGRKIKPCLPPTRIEVLSIIRAWLNSVDQKHVFWLVGRAGSGKSTIAKTIAEEVSEDPQQWLASFFFSRNEEDLRDGKKFVSTLARDLAQQWSEFHTALNHVLLWKQHDLLGRQVDVAHQWRELIAEPISRLDPAQLPPRLVIVVDALDECESKEHIDDILKVLQNSSPFKHTQLRVLITSRPEYQWSRNIPRVLHESQSYLELHAGVAQSTVNRDLAILVKHTFETQNLRFSKADVEKLVDRSAGIFAWAAAACQHNTMTRIQNIIKNPTVDTFLDSTYLAILKQSSAHYDGEERKQFCNLQRTVLGPIALLQSSLPGRAVACLLRLKGETVKKVFDCCHSILDVSRDDWEAKPISLLHPSFRHFLSDPARCQDQDLFVCEEDAHQLLFSRCKDILCTNLKRDIHNVKAPGTTVWEVPKRRLDEVLSPEVQYACLYWITHLLGSGLNHEDLDEDLDSVGNLLNLHFLQWVEALSWMQRISEAVSCISKLETKMETVLREGTRVSIQTRKMAEELLAGLQDASQFIQYHRVAIERCPLQLYSSSLIFSPISSRIRKQHNKDEPNCDLNERAIETDWHPSLYTLDGHRDSVTSIAWTENRIASGSHDQIIKIWDSETGRCISELAHSGKVTSVAWRRNGSRLASGSRDGIVMVWDPMDGACPKLMLKEHRKPVTSVTWSQDGNYLASGSDDKTVKIWDLATGQCISTLDQHLNPVASVAWSQDGSRLASGSRDGIVRIWDTTTIEEISTLHGHSESVSSVAWSPNGKRLASGSRDKTVKVWHLATGRCISMFVGHTNWVTSIAWSPDGSPRLASGSYDRTIRIWDLSTNQCISTFEGKSNLITSIAWSPNGKRLASASDDNIIRIWDSAARQRASAPQGHRDSVTFVAWSPDGSRLASVSKDRSVRIWDPTNGQCTSTLKEHQNSVTSIAWSHDGSRIALGSCDRTVRIWDTTDRLCISMPRNHSHPVTSLAWSDDGNRLASADKDTIRVWDLATKTCIKTPDDILSRNMRLEEHLQHNSLEPGVSLAISPGPSIPTPKPKRYGLSKDTSWITYGGKNLLWLPPEYRPQVDSPHAHAAFEATMAIGCASGRVLILKLSLDGLLQ